MQLSIFTKVNIFHLKRLKAKSGQKKPEVREMLLEIGFIEETRTTRGNTEVPQTFFSAILIIPEITI